MFFLVMVQVLVLGNGACPRYRCLQHTNSTCLSSDGDTVAVSRCPVGSYCPPVLGAEKGSCEAEELRTERAWPGETCHSRTSCVSGLCEGGRCVGQSMGEECQSHADCNAPLYCNRQGKCDLQIYESSWLPCRDDYDCRNYLTCQFGTCVPYLSRSEGEQVSNCVGNSSLACASTLCFSNYCLMPLKNDKPIPAECNSAAECTSSWYSSESRPFLIHTQCNCALDTQGRGVCQLFPGDPPYLDYLTSLQHVLQRKHNWGCHTLRRFSLECLDATEYHRNYADLVSKYVLAEHYAELVYSEPCVQQVFFPQYLLALQLHAAALMLLVLT